MNLLEMLRKNAKRDDRTDPWNRRCLIDSLDGTNAADAPDAGTCRGLEPSGDRNPRVFIELFCSGCEAPGFHTCHRLGGTNGQKRPSHFMSATL
jgi:hypothetical protein